MLEIKWSRNSDKDKQTFQCKNLTPEHLVSRLKAAIRQSGPVTIYSVREQSKFVAAEKENDN